MAPPTSRLCRVTAQKPAKAAVCEPVANANGKTKVMKALHIPKQKENDCTEETHTLMQTHPKDTPAALTYTDNTALTHCTAYFFFPPNDIFSVFFFCASLNKKYTFMLANGLMRVCECV